MRKRLLLSTALVATPCLAEPVNPSFVLEPSEVVVHAVTPLADIGEGALAPPAQTASDEEIERAHAIGPADYLARHAGGVFINEIQGNPLQPDVSYRGFTASPLLGTAQGLSVHMDGVRLNQPFGDVVSWDLIPKSAIRSISLVPAVNPLFGRNALGGALAIATKDGRSDPGVELEASLGSFRRRMAEVQLGGSDAKSGVHWFVSGDYFRERGWRDLSPSRAVQGFGKLGWADADSDVSLSGSVADTDLNGNGLQEMRLLEADRRSIYTAPDTTQNRAVWMNLKGRQSLSPALTVAANVYVRSVRTHSFNGDVNDDALGQNPYQPTEEEQEALADAGFEGFPESGETATNTPFPKWRCIANVLLNDEPHETCTGLANRSSTRQREWGASAELTLDTPLAAGRNRLSLGVTYTRSRADFVQTTQFGYLLPDRTVMAVDGPGAFADGSQEGEEAFDARVDMTGRTTNVSLYASDALDLTRTLHVELSGRYDRTAISNRDHITPGGGTGSLDSDPVYHRFNPAAAIRWSPSRAIAFDLAAGQTSRAPSSVELGCSDPESPCRLPNALAGDPPLRQVVAQTVEAGVNLTVQGVTLRVGAFRTVSRDDILFVTSDASGFGYFRNFGRTRRQGVDIDAAGRLGPVRLSAHYSLLDATFRSAETVDGSANSSNDGEGPGFEGAIAIQSGDRIPLIPRHNFKASASWDPIEQLSLTVDMVAQSGVVARGNENGAHEPDGLYYLGRGETAAHAVLNMGVEVRPRPAVTLFAEVNNLLDARYATAAQLGPTAFDAAGGFVAQPFDGPEIDGELPLLSSTFFAPGAPRSIRIGARLRF